MKADKLASITADLKELVNTKNCGPILIRLSWHDVGKFSTGKLTGGCPNAAMRFTDGGEGKFGANAGLPTVAVGLLKDVAHKYVPSDISFADLWALAANVAIKEMGGPAIPTRFGRVDATSSAESVESQVGRLPDGDKGVDHLCRHGICYCGGVVFRMDQESGDFLEQGVHREKIEKARKTVRAKTTSEGEKICREIQRNGIEEIKGTEKGI